ncbi:GNAT family N-acetyltransferase [Stakelama saccharophila]|uniref:GNAT family N-acetyltransferase n=1 Tax=Stakelama saccharophila TaxID=3075605 RepID=A0ABZ0B801_9SPHN|nr:GNAT family N-acetyltransferase [Stakelama sp. W311]WNO52988.1 GNAT family N-acetyltransferase [Stakelama sp. W311]
MIETERLLLRVPQAGDFAALAAMWADPAVMADLAPVKTAEESRETLARHDGYRDRGLGFLVVAKRRGGAVIGFAGLKPGAEGTPIDGEIEAGWMLARDHWARGYAIEAMQAVLADGWRRFPAERIVAITAACNQRSLGLMRRLGMQELPGGGFEHPKYPVGDDRRSTVTYVLPRPRADIA